MRYESFSYVTINVEKCVTFWEKFFKYFVKFLMGYHVGFFVIQKINQNYYNDINYVKPLRAS